MDNRLFIIFLIGIFLRVIVCIDLFDLSNIKFLKKNLCYYNGLWILLMVNIFSLEFKWWFWIRLKWVKLMIFIFKLKLVYKVCIF